MSYACGSGEYNQKSLTRLMNRKFRPDCIKKKVVCRGILHMKLIYLHTHTTHLGYPGSPVIGKKGSLTDIQDQ